MTLWYLVLGKVLGAVASCAYDYRVSSEDMENLRLLKKYLQKHSIVVYFNHIFLGDGPLVLAFLLNTLGDSIQAIGVAESQKHYDFTRSPLHALILRAGSLLGVKAFPVVQHYDRDAYTYKERLTLLRNFVSGARQILSRAGGVFIIAPEGTRSQDGTLQKAQSGIKHLGSYGSVYFFPVGIVPLDEFDREISLGSKFRLRLGEPFSLYKLSEKTPDRVSLTDSMMLRLADLLPENMRGFYACHPKS